MESILKAEHLNFRYTEMECITDLSLSFGQGEMVSIIGPNGSGKSTALRILSRLLKPNKGTVFLEGENIHSLKDKVVAQKLTMLPQIHDHHLDMTVRDLIKNGRRPYLKWFEDYNKEQDRYIDWALEVTNLVSLQNRSLQTLSGGERQRAWIAMAIAQTPNTLLLDEPTSYLDISHQLEVMELLKELNKDLGITIIMVLHDLNQAAKYSDRIIAMKNGKVVKQGKPIDVYDAAFFREVFSIEAKIHVDENIPMCAPSGLVQKTNREWSVQK
ncbi:ABC transporter ATP-binding protein [Robertmurraya massiliosenegalensis]